MNDNLNASEKNLQTNAEELGNQSKKKSLDFSKYYPLFFTLVFIIILFQYSLSTLEAIFYDLRIKYDFGTKSSTEIVLVTIDEESDQFLGEIYPYTFTSHSRTLENLIKDKPFMIGYFVDLVGPESDEDQTKLEEFKGVLNSYVGNGGFFRFATQLDEWGEQLPPKELQEFGFSLAQIHLDNSAFAKDDVSRRAVLNISGEDSFHLWAANIFRESQNEEPIAAKAFSGSYYSKEADATFGLIRFFTNPKIEDDNIKKIPFHQVRVGNFKPGFFKNKIVFIGPSYISNSSNYILTPFQKEKYETSRMNMHAIITQALINDETVQPMAKSFTYFLSFLMAIFLSIVIMRVRPSKGLLITIGVMLGTVLTSYLLFSLFGIWLYMTHLILTVVVVYYIWVPFRAIGEYQRRYAIQEEAKLLKKVENLKQNFISLMSHDLKTPVAKIAGLADIMIKQRLFTSDIAEKNLYSIVDSTRELNRFITSILDLTKVESANLNLRLTTKDINKVIEEVIKNLNYEAKSKNISFNLDLAPLYPITFDVTLINRVISNLVENAIKYSGENSQVSISSWDDDNWVYIDISDNGVGIGAGDLEHIFDKFYRVKNDASHSIKGSGLGLYLVKYFVELHGGTISATSEVGQGTNFHIKLKNQ